MTEPEDSPYSLTESRRESARRARAIFDAGGPMVEAARRIVERRRAQRSREYREDVIRDMMRNLDEAAVTVLPADFFDELMSEDIPDDEFNDALERAKVRSAEVLRQLGVDEWTEDPPIEVVEIDDLGVALRSPRTGDVYGVFFNFVGGEEAVRLDLLHRGDEPCEHCPPRA